MRQAVGMELDSKGLGRLQRVANARDVWVSEAGDFTPCLAENIDVLADALGMVLTVTGTEVPVGECRLDIKAEDDDGRVVIIENQLERTDHSHLGQCLLYAAGLDASTVVWVAPTFRDDFRRTFDWLNERTDLGINFFGVEVSVVQIGDEGPRAPVFEVLSRPNEWQKAVKGSGSGSSSGSSLGISPLNAQRQDFFAEVLTELIATHPAIRMPARNNGNWLPFASGPFGSWSMCVTWHGQLRVEAYLDAGDKARNKLLFDEMANQAAKWDELVGTTLTWERLDDRRACRIAAYHTVDLDDGTARSQAKEWAVNTLSAMYGVLNSELRSRASTIRKEAVAAEDAAMASAHDAGDPADFVPGTEPHSG
jgi:hypothetical protein